jgi:hypothetical protein
MFASAMSVVSLYLKTLSLQGMSRGQLGFLAVLRIPTVAGRDYFAHVFYLGAIFRR